ncbi:MAG: hypothetical protein K6E49_03990 [Lachnospiraceae bacterium]|nr:hypothetical protein [Lachnospiraceae bacterium]
MTKVMQCRNAEELIKLAGENGIEVSKEEAEAFLDEYADVELDEKMLDQAAGGSPYSCPEEHLKICSKDGFAKPESVKDRNRNDE